MPLVFRSARRQHPDPPQLAVDAIPLPPTFVGVGAQKCGTSWWFSLIAQHPEVVATAGAEKEAHFFDRFWADPSDDAMVAEYHALFARPAGTIAGEWTPRYMFDPWTPPLLATAAPAAKLLVLLRDPVDRFGTGLTHSLTHDRLRPHAMTATDAFNRGLYGSQLRRLFDTWPADQVLVLQYERCVDDTAAELARTFRFIGADPAFVPDDLTERVRETTVARTAVPDHLEAALRAAYQPDLELLVGLAPDIDLSRWPTATRA
jgi:hypothetical protein